MPQPSPEQDACNALVLCSNPITTPGSYVGTGLVNDLTSTPCSAWFTTAGEQHSVWVKVYVQTPGMVVFKIIPTYALDDYDFAVLDITNTTCSNLQPSDVIRCNFNNNLPGSNINGIIGVGPSGTLNFVTGGGTGSSYCAPIYATAGTVLLLMINNFGPSGPNPVDGFTLDFDGSTATFFDALNPTMETVAPSCNGTHQATIQMSEYIQCSSIAPNGSDFSITGGPTLISAIGQSCTAGITDKIDITLSAPLPPGTYTLSAQTGTDGNTLLDLCGNPLLLPHSIELVIPNPVLAFEVIDPPSCSEIKIKMTKKLWCDSLAADGSDFLVTGPAPVNVVAAYGAGCDTNNLTDSVVLLLQHPIHTDGQYSVIARSGTDGDTQVDSCGNSQAIGDQITFTINTYDGVIVSSRDSILCHINQIQLNAVNFAQPPLTVPNCGATTAACTGAMMQAFIGGRDTLGDVNTPFSGSRQDAKGQFLYLAEELKSRGLKPGSIRSVEWFIGEKNSSIPYTDFTIKIGCTPVNSLASSFVTGTEVVYTSASYSSVQGWNKFDLTTPYNWDGTSNLIVEVCYDNNWVSGNDKVLHSQTGFNSVFRRAGNNLAGCAMMNQGTIQSWSNIRPKIRFSICEPPPGPQNFAWTPASPLSDSTIQQPVALMSTSTTFHVSTVDRFGCIHRDSTVFTFSERYPELQPIIDTICEGDEIAFLASGGETYSWVTSDPSLTCWTCPDPTATPQTTSKYAVIIGDQHKCQDTLEADIFVNPRPEVQIAVSDSTVAYGTRIQLEGSGAPYYSWSPLSVIDHPHIYNPTALINGPVMIILNGLNEYGCADNDTVNIEVDYRDPLFIPSAFSPNNDGRNDVFRIGSLSFQKLQEFRIFNRWGQQIFSTQDPVKGWDGTINGVVQDVGVYHYIIRVAYPDGKVETYKGDVTLVR